MARMFYTEAEVVTIAGREELDKAIEDGTLQTFRNRNKRMFRAYQVDELWSGIQREYSREYNSPENKCSTESEIHGAGSTESASAYLRASSTESASAYLCASSTESKNQDDIVYSEEGTALGSSPSTEMEDDLRPEYDLSKLKRVPSTGFSKEGPGIYREKDFVAPNEDTAKIAVEELTEDEYHRARLRLEQARNKSLASISFAIQLFVGLVVGAGVALLLLG